MDGSKTGEVGFLSGPGRLNLLAHDQGNYSGLKFLSEPNYLFIAEGIDPMMSTSAPLLMQHGMEYKPKAMIFDLLTALLDSWATWESAVPEGSDVDGQTWRKRYLELTYNCGEYVAYEKLVSQSAKDVGLPTIATTTLCEKWDKIQPWDEASHILVTLKSLGYKLGVVTNCSNELGLRAVQGCTDVVERVTGQSFQFDAVVTAEESGFYKPRPKPYLDVLKKLQVTADEALFVAGSAADIPGASGVGMMVCWHNRVGLERKNEVIPMREGETLQATLEPFLTSA